LTLALLSIVIYNIAQKRGRLNGKRGFTPNTWRAAIHEWSAHQFRTGTDNLQNEVNELKTTTNELKATTNELKATTNELKETTDLLRISVLNIELVEMPKIQAALDGVVGNAEKIADHEKRITRLEYA